MKRSRGVSTLSVGEGSLTRGVNEGDKEGAKIAYYKSKSKLTNQKKKKKAAVNHGGEERKAKIKHPRGGDLVTPPREREKPITPLRAGLPLGEEEKKIGSMRLKVIKTLWEGTGRKVPETEVGV